MKKPLLIGLSLLSAGLITGIYAQTTTAGTSIMDKMKAVAHSFTLSSTLNPTDTGLTSDPVKGKKTGDILTAGEWNRVLELVSEGGSGAGGSGWVDVPLTDTNPFDHNGCQYRVKLTGPAYNAAAGFSADGYFSSDYVTAGVVQFDSGIFIKSGTKNIVYVIDQNNGAIVEVTTAWGWRPTKIEKLCGAAGGAPATVAGGSATIVEGGIIKTSPKTISNWDLITLEGSWNSGGGDAAPTGGYIYKLGGQAKLAYVEASGISKDITLTTTAQNVHNLSVKLSGDSVIIDPSSSNTLAYIVWKLGGSSSGTQSGPVYINPDNTDFAPLDCTPGTTYMINPIVYGAASASTYTDKKLANLKPGNWKLTGSGFLRIRNHDSGSSQTLRVSTVMDGVVTHLLNNTVDIGFYANQVSSSFSVPASKTVDLQVSIRNNALQGGNIVLWCVN